MYSGKENPAPSAQKGNTPKTKAQPRGKNYGGNYFFSQNNYKLKFLLTV